MSISAEHRAPAGPQSPEMDAATLKTRLAEGRALVVDVREPDEFAKEHIPGATLLPLSRFDPSGIPAGRTVVLHCASGRRSAEAAARMAAAGRTDAVQLKGGIGGWKAAGLPLEGNPKLPISIMRQVQVTAGSLVVAGSLLAAFVSAWFLLLTAFIGLGLMFAGMTGTCGMASMLRVMPWNRGFQSACGAADTPGAGTCH